MVMAQDVPSWLMEHPHCLLLCDRWPTVGGESALEHEKPWLGTLPGTVPDHKALSAQSPSLMELKTAVFIFPRDGVG